MEKRIAQICPKTGQVFYADEPQPRRRWPSLLWPVTGLLALAWFLIRVIPKPSRAAYPCQRAAAPLASAFVVWIIGLATSTLIFRRVRRLAGQSRYLLASLLVALAVGVIWTCLAAANGQPLQAQTFSPTEPANTPMGVARGIFPGRVVWTRDAQAAKWDGSTGSWWDDTHTDQKAVDAMVSKTLQDLTGQSSDGQAWTALFKYFNKNAGAGEVGYRKGEKVAIKINMNEDNKRPWVPNAGMPSPHVVYAVVGQLIREAGVPGDAITIYDASRYIGDPIYNKVRGNPDPQYQAVTFVVAPIHAGDGRIAAVADPNVVFRTKAGALQLPTCLTRAKYLINLALIRPHTMFGATLCAKNHFGSTYFPDGGGWTPRPLHNTGSRDNPMGSYNCLVDLNGHQQTGGKTLLYMIDGLYPARHQMSTVMKWTTFGPAWFASLLASQDMVALDSVCLDFLRAEQAANPTLTDVRGQVDNYLHEAALMGRPASGAKYDPEQDGTIPPSLGVHEHWNNAAERKYSRNLQTGAGIELVTRSEPRTITESTATKMALASDIVTGNPVR
jgi:uncharacterized protein (DUF362 family)